MASFGQRLKDLRIERSLTQEGLIKIINEKYNRKISKSMISKWENDKEKPQHISDIKAIADYFGVSDNYLIGISVTTQDIRNDFKKIPIFNVLLPNIPIYEQTDVLNYEYISNEDKVDFGLKVTDDSLIGIHIYDGDIIYVRMQHDVDNGELAVVIDNEQVAFKRVYKIKNFIILRSDNPKYQEKIYFGKDKRNVKILGKILFLKRQVK